MPQDYDAMTEEELVTLNQELTHKRAAANQEIEDQQMAVTAALDKKIRERRLLGDVSEMPMEEREALIQALQSAPPPKPPEETAEGGVEVVEITEGDVATVEGVVTDG